MGITRIVAGAELGAALLGTLLGAVIVFIALRAWWRSGKGVFLLFAMAQVAILYVNAFTAAILFFSVFQIPLIPVTFVGTLYAAQAVFALFGLVISFVANVLLIRIALSTYSHETPSQTMQQTSDRPYAQL